jgi:hypothetical protein
MHNAMRAAFVAAVRVSTVRAAALNRRVGDATGRCGSGLSASASACSPGESAGAR